MPRIKRSPKFKIYGNIFDQIAVSKTTKQETLLKRHMVSTDWIQLWYLLMDGKFNSDLFNQLDMNERLLLSRMYKYMELPENRELNIALSKTMKGFHERLRFIESAIRAGNLSSELKTEYYDIMDKLIQAGYLSKITGAYQKKMMENT